MNCGWISECLLLNKSSKAFQNDLIDQLLQRTIIKSRVAPIYGFNLQRSQNLQKLDFTCQFLEKYHG